MGLVQPPTSLSIILSPRYSNYPMRLTTGKDNLPTATAIRPAKVLFVSIETNRLHGPDALVEARGGSFLKAELSNEKSWLV